MSTNHLRCVERNNHSLLRRRTFQGTCYTGTTYNGHSRAPVTLVPPTTDIPGHLLHWYQLQRTFQGTCYTGTTYNGHSRAPVTLVPSTTATSNRGEQQLGWAATGSSSNRGEQQLEETIPYKTRFIRLFHLHSPISIWSQHLIYLLRVHE